MASSSGFVPESAAKDDGPYSGDPWKPSGTKAEKEKKPEEEEGGEEEEEQQGQEEQRAEAYERQHVHGVYEAIAPHFSATRHKPWPLVADFLRAQPPGAVGLDVGCGNGKYLSVNRDVFLLGSDRSSALVALARHRGSAESGVGSRTGGAGSDGDDGGRRKNVTATGAAAARSTASTAQAEVLVADGLFLPFRREAADFVICVAVIHHLSTRERRQDGIRQLLQCVPPLEVPSDDSSSSHTAGGGKVLVYVWALEQESSRRGWEEGGEQDLLVPWVMRSQRHKGEKAAAKGATSGERTPDLASETSQKDLTFQRYYHLYRKGEIEEDVRAAGGKVLSSGYEKDNWWAIAVRAS